MCQLLNTHERMKLLTADVLTGRANFDPLRIRAHEAQ
jgi:hypothetical protein